MPVIPAIRREDKAGRLQVPGKPELHSETSSQKKKKKKNCLAIAPPLTAFETAATGAGHHSS
jgi:hypothetical protein